jgi:glucosamine--fructose-6-phosphate aminotransferase (isomerizing)
MCGIVGYIGPKPLVPILLEGLRKLEYRGYDSAGIAVVSDGKVAVRRSSGKLINLVKLLETGELKGDYGIGHTRWATHGRPTEENAHPHRLRRKIAGHNGIIENYLELKHELQEQGHHFVTETDTEIVAHLVESLMPGRALSDAVGIALARLRGSFAVCIRSADTPNTIVTARNGPPLIIGQGEDELLVASDVPALLQHTRNVYFMQDGEMAILSPEGVQIKDFRGNRRPFSPEEISWSSEMAERGGYPHFMLKEIHEQPRAIQDTIRPHFADTGQVFLNEANLSEEVLASSIASTSWPAQSLAFGGRKVSLQEPRASQYEVD